MKNKIPSNWKNCATCSHWCGWKNPDAFCSFVEFDMDEKARCAEAASITPKPAACRIAANGRSSFPTNKLNGKAGRWHPARPFASMGG